MYTPVYIYNNKGGAPVDEIKLIYKVELGFGNYYVIWNLFVFYCKINKY